MRREGLCSTIHVFTACNPSSPKAYDRSLDAARVAWPRAPKDLSPTTTQMRAVRNTRSMFVSPTMPTGAASSSAVNTRRSSVSRCVAIFSHSGVRTCLPLPKSSHS